VEGATYRAASGFVTWPEHGVKYLLFHGGILDFDVLEEKFCYSRIRFPKQSVKNIRLRITLEYHPLKRTSLLNDCKFESYDFLPLVFHLALI